MNATVTAPSSCKKEISIEIPAADVDVKFEEKVKKYKKEMKVPGFRPGKIPTDMVKQRFGDSIRGEVIEELMNSAFQTACVENKITPVAEPAIENVKAEAGENISYTATVEVDPEIEVTGYKDLTVKVDIEETTDADIEEAIKNIQEQYAQFNDLEDSAAKEGNIITLKYSEVSVDGEAKDGLNPAPQMVEVGKAPIKELNDALNGVKKDDEKKLSITLPEDFQVAEIAGKKCDFTIVVENVQEKVIAEVNDELAKKLNFDTVDALRDAIKKDISKHKETNGKSKAQDEAIDKILEKGDFEVPETRVTHYLQHIMKEEEKYYPNGGQPSVEEYAVKYTDVAKKSLKRFRILDYIAKNEKVKATQEEVDVKIQEIADQYQQPFETVKAAFRQNGTTVQIREDVKEAKILDCLVGLAEWPAAE